MRVCVAVHVRIKKKKMEASQSSVLNVQKSAPLFLQSNGTTRRVREVCVGVLFWKKGGEK